MRKLSFLAGFGAGYVLGSHAGRERYDQIVQTVQGVKRNPAVQITAEKVSTQASDLASTVKETVASKIDEHRHADEVTIAPVDITVIEISQPGSGSTNGRMGL